MEIGGAAPSETTEASKTGDPPLGMDWPDPRIKFFLFDQEGQASPPTADGRMSRRQTAQNPNFRVMSGLATRTKLQAPRMLGCDIYWGHGSDKIAPSALSSKVITPSVSSGCD